jgi:hypothetical protein
MKFNAVTGVLGTDYEILNADVGLIRIKPTTTKVGPVLVSYTPTAYTSTTGPTVIAGGHAADRQGENPLRLGQPLRAESHDRGVGNVGPSRWRARPDLG